MRITDMNEYTEQNKADAEIEAERKRYQSKDARPICPNCGQWQYQWKDTNDCFNECVKRNLVRA